MKLFEYMGKDLFRAHGIKVPAGQVAATPAEAVAAWRHVGGPVVVKPQVLTGKRGKAGGIRFVDSAAAVAAAAGDVLAMEFGGLKVDKLLVEEKIAISREYYLALTVDGAAGKTVLIASASGGMDIEEVAEEGIVKRHIDPLVGVMPYVGREVAGRLGLTGEPLKQFADLVVRLHRAYRASDAELCEINPLVWTGAEFVAADAKVTIDDDALFRQKDLPRVAEKTDVEKAAADMGLAFVQLDGDIAVMANGAGITMATLDTLSHLGGAPANFLDAGGGTGTEGTVKALELLLGLNPKVIFINIFGGITRCDDVARAVVRFKSERLVKVPLVIRMVGTNEAEGLRILREAGIPAHRVMVEAAASAVALAGKGA
ncbi:MAG: ADP-forming succinate--CoA ligase subunit beta [Peptococcaceae bacterium]|nr:ADP-forming succinate--CoA ligase subunit beta [Peptococcaceae bacterium]